MGATVTTPRVAAIVGPYTSGKTSLLESLLTVSGTLRRRGRVTEGTTLGDGAPESRDRQMSTELTVAPARFMDQDWVFLDCPGSVEFQQDALDALMVADVAVVVVDPEPERAMMVTPLLKVLDAKAIPHMVFINKVDRDGATISIRACLESLQLVSERPLVLREIPIREGDQITGYVDLVSERAYRYQPGEASDLIKLPDSVRDRESEARREMLESLADFDDHLLEELLEDVQPPRDEVYGDLARDLAADLVVPVFFGSADKDEGVRRLWKALRHDVPSHEAARRRLAIAESGVAASVFKTRHASHTGKLSLARVWSGEITDGLTVQASTGSGGKINGLYGITGQDITKVAAVPAGGVAALGRLDDVPTGALVGDTVAEAPAWPAPLPPLFALALSPRRQGDDVKLTAALAQMTEEDRSLSVEQTPGTGELLLWGQGDIHLQVALARLARLGHVEVEVARPQVPYQETLKGSTQVRGRFKRQSGGHGQFGDVHLTLQGLPRGAGVQFSDSITGGVVPKQYIPAVEAGVREWAARGPLGFPVVDFSVDLFDGSYHVVDSSEAAFKAAAGQAMRDGAAKCSPTLLEPVLAVEVSVPSDATSKAQRALSGRRGQILGFMPKDGWAGWDVIQAHVPQAEMHDLITEIRSASRGVGTFSWAFDHLQELTGKAADQVVEARAKALA
jgi:elongation factor G